jgi:ribosomal protein L16/L10AE
MQQPKRTKFRKAFKGRIHGLAKGGTDLNFGAFGMKALEPGRVMFEIDGVPEELASEAIQRGAAKLPIETRFIKRLQAAVGEGEVAA